MILIASSTYLITDNQTEQLVATNQSRYLVSLFPIQRNMSGEEEIADIDPTPIHHPVDDDAIASAVKDAAAEVADETMDHEFDSDVIHHQDEVEVEDERVNNDDHDNDKTSIKEDEARTADSENIRAMILKEDEERINKSKAPKRRARRVGKVPVRKVPKLGEPPVLEERVEPPVVEEIVAEPSVVDTLPRVLSKHDEKWNSMLRELEAFKVRIVASFECSIVMVDLTYSLSHLALWTGKAWQY